MRLERRSITSKVRADVNHDAVLRDSVCRSLQRPQPPHNSFPMLAPLCGPQQAVARRSLSDRTAYRREVAPTRSQVEGGTTGNPPRDRCRSGPTEHAQRVSAHAAEAHVARADVWARRQHWASVLATWWPARTGHRARAPAAGRARLAALAVPVGARRDHARSGAADRAGPQRPRSAQPPAAVALVLRDKPALYRRLRRARGRPRARLSRAQGATSQRRRGRGARAPRDRRT
jgi:hypothetical protein